MRGSQEARAGEQKGAKEANKKQEEGGGRVEGESGWSGLNSSVINNLVSQIVSIY